MCKFITLLSLVSLMLFACSPAELAAIDAAGRVVGGAVDAFALARADAIRAKGAQAEQLATNGDTLGAMKALDEALAFAAAQTIRELQEVKARCGAPPPAPALSGTATASPTTSSAPLPLAPAVLPPPAPTTTATAAVLP